MAANQTFQRLTLKLKDSATLDGLIILSFFVLGFVGIINHEMWRDELQAWMIARDSTSVAEVIENLRAEGHPATWYLCLYFLSRFTRNPLAMQIFHLFIATGAIFLFIKYSPFKTLHKFLFAFSYFPFYEYGIISRNYALEVLLIFLFCALFPNGSRNFLIIAIVLAFLANVNAFGLLLNFSLLSGLLIRIYINRKKYPLKKGRIGISLSLIAFGWVLSLWQIARAASNAEVVQTTPNLPQKTLFTEVVDIGNVVRHVWESYVPIPDFTLDFWSTNFLSDSSLFLSIGSGDTSIGDAIAGILSIGLLIVSVWLLLEKPVALITYILGTSSLLLFFYLVYDGGLRHHGHLFILLIACLWISRYESSTAFLVRLPRWVSNFGDRARNRFLSVLLCIHLAVGIFAYSMDLAYPFSVGEEAAKFIESHQLSHLTIIGTRNTVASTISAYLDKPIYYPEEDRFGTFWKVRTSGLTIVDKQKLFEAISKLQPQSQTGILLVLTKKLDVNQPDLRVKALASFDEGMIEGDELHLYLVENNRSL